MDLVYRDLIESWRFLKKGKQNTAFATVKPSGQLPPWFIIGKAAEVGRRAKPKHFKEVEGYLATKVMQGRVERVGKQIYLVVDADACKGVRKILSKGIARLRKHGGIASESEDAEIAKNSGFLKKLAVVMKRAAVLSEEEYEELLESGDAPGEQSLVNDPEEDEPLDDATLTEEDLEAVFGKDAAEVVAAVQTATKLLEAIDQEHPDERAQQEAVAELLDMVDGEAGADVVAEGIVKALLGRPLVVEASEVGHPMDDRVLAGLLQDALQDFSFNSARVRANHTSIAEETSMLAALKSKSEAPGATPDQIAEYAEAVRSSEARIEPLLSENRQRLKAIAETAILIETVLRPTSEED